MIKRLFMLSMVFWAVAAWMVAAGGPVAAKTPELVAGETRRVVEVIDGDTVVLAEPVEGSREVRLVGLQAPKLPLDRPNFRAWPLAEDSKRALESLVLGREVRLSYGGQRRDRHGRRLAQLHLADGTWVQGRMLSLGMARVYTFADNRAEAAAMLALESEARRAGRGLWAHPYYAVLTPERAAKALDTFQLVEGTVLDAAKVKGRLYLNFGPDWRTDFTATADAKALRLFAEAGLDPLPLEGRTLRLRGWLKSMNGPLIELSHPEQIERIAP